MTTRTRGVVAAVGLAMGYLAAAALAAPPVLDRVPDNAMLVVAATSADAIQKDVQAFITATDIPIPMLPKIEDLLAGGGITQGLDITKSFALVLFAPTPEKMAEMKAKADAKKAGHKHEADKDGKHDAKADDKDIDDDDDDDATAAKDQPLVVLVPVTSYADLIKNFDVAKPAAAGGVDPVTMPDGSENFLRDVGNGYAAFSPNKDLLAKFDAKSGPASIKSKLGKAGDKLADSSDIVTIVNMDAVRPLWPEIKKQMAKSIKEQTDNLPIPGGAAANPLDNPAFVWFSDTLMRDGKALVGGIKTGNTGLNLDMAVNFNDGTPMAKMLDGKSHAGSLLAKLPATPYLFAGAFDISTPELKAWFKELASKGADTGKSMGLGAVADPKRIDSTDGMAVVVGVPVGGIFGGLTTSTITYTSTKDVPGLIASQKQAFADMNGKQQEVVTTETTYKDASTKVDGVDVDEYSLKIKVDPNSEAGDMAPQAINAIFGPTGGPAGYIAKADGGVYQTFGKNSALLTQAMKAGKGGENLGSDKMMSQVGEAMPGTRIAEAYIGTKGLLDLIVPAAAMFTGVQIPPEQIPDSLPPVGMALSGHDGSAHFSLFVPAPVIKTGVKLGMTVKEQMDGGGEEAAPDKDDKGDKKGGKTGTGQPRF